MVLLALLLLPGCGVADSHPTEQAAPPEKGFDYLYPDNPDSEKTPVSVPTETDGPWKLSHLMDHGGSDTLSHVVAAAPDDIWAFGRTESWKGKPFALRWNGDRWATSPLPKEAKGAVLDVAGSGPDDLWLLTGNTRNPTAFHRTGERWTIQDGLPYGTRFEVLDATHVWAYSPGAIQSIFFYDGNGWKPAALPDGVGLKAFDATSPADLWALGSVENGGKTATGVYRSDGLGWTRVPLGDALPADDRDTYVDLELLLATSDDDVWVIGNQVPRPEEESEAEPVSVPVAAHWDGRSWHRIDVQRRWRPYQAVADGRGGVRILVRPNPGDPDAVAPTTTILSLSADGTSSTSAPEIFGGRVSLNALAAISGTIWAVGAAYPPQVTMSASTSVAYVWTP